MSNELDYDIARELGYEIDSNLEDELEYAINPNLVYEVTDGALASAAKAFPELAKANSDEIARELEEE